MSSTYKQGAALSVTVTLVSKLFSFVTGILIAWLFGADGKTDIYFYIVLLAALLNGWLQNINISVIVPEFMHLRKENKLRATAFANFFIYIYFICAALIIILCYLLPGTVLGLISSFPRELILQNMHMAGLGAVYFTSFFLMTFLLSITETFKFFRIYFLSPLNTLLGLALIIITRRIEAVLIGYSAAYIIQIAACLIVMRFKAGWDFKPFKPEFGKKFKNNFLYNQPNSFIWAALLYTPLFMVSGGSAGMVSALNYSRMLSDSPVDIFVSRLNNVAKVKITAHAAENDFKEMARTLVRTDNILLFLLIPFCVFTSFYALDIIKVFFLRGSFTPGDALNAAVFLRFFILAVPLISLHNNLTNMFAAMRIIKEITPRYFLLAAAFILIFIFGIRAYGVFAYPAAFLLLYITILALNIITARQFAPFADYGRHMLYIMKIFLISFLCAGFIKIVFGGFSENSFLNLLLNGSLFVALNLLASRAAGDIKLFKEAVNIKWKLR